MRRTPAKFGLPFEKATQLVHFPKALKRPRNNAGPAGIGLLIMTGIGLLLGKKAIMQRGSIEHEQIIYESSNRRMKQLMDWLSNSH